MKRLYMIVYCLLSFVISAGVTSIAQTTSENSIINPPKQLLVTRSISDNNLVTLAGNTRPEANARNDRGRVPDNVPIRMILVLRRSPQQEQALEQFMAQQTDPGSPYFHQWLTPQQFGERYGLAQADINKISGWLEEHGFRVDGVHPGRTMLNIVGTAGQVRQTFHTEIHYVNVKGVKHVANMSDPKIPVALAPAVGGVVGLNNFRPHPQYQKVDYTFSGCGTGSNCYFLTPADFATIYNTQPLLDEGYTGKGQTIYIIQDSDLNSPNDWNTYISTFGLTQYGGTFSQTHPQSPPGWNYPCTDPGYLGADPEPNLDVELSSAMAPAANIVLASCEDYQGYTYPPPDTTGWFFGGYAALLNIIATSNASASASIMSISFGDSESVEGTSANEFIEEVYQMAASEGYSVFVSAGDHGGDISEQALNPSSPYAILGINVNGMASTPYNVAVGGTDFSDVYSKTSSTYWSSSNGSTYGSALSYIPEIPWNDSCASALIAEYNGFSETYGASGFCNSSTGQNYPGVVGGSGGPSACAGGTPNIPGAANGGCSGYGKPSWQAVFGNPADGVRDLPDVSLFAANGVWGHAYSICFSDTSGGGSPCTGAPSSWLGVGGTSGSAPMMAGIQALINQATGTAAGNPNPTYYSLAATQYGASGDSSCNSSNGNGVSSGCIFYDVTMGDNDQPCEGNLDCYLPAGTWGVLSTSDSAFQPAFAAQTGWDFATGIGTINAYNLVNAFSNGTKATTTTTITLTPGASAIGSTTPVTIAATVKPSSGSGTPTGPVTFYIGSLLLGEPVDLSNGQASYQYDVSGLAGGQYTITAIYGVGDSTYASSTSSPVTLDVMGFKISASPAAITIGSPGQSGQTTLTISPLGGFNETLSYACSGLPSGAKCTFAAASATTETLTISTTAATSKLERDPLRRNRQLFYALALPGLLGIVMAGGRRTKYWWMTLALALCLILLLPACGGGESSSTSGGGGSTGTTGTPGTPTGNSVVTLTATASGTVAMSQQMTITLTVQ